MIPRRPLGVTGIVSPILGFGVSGPHGGRLVPSRRTEALVRAAIEAGAGLIDTAPFYGDAELRVARALRGVDRDGVVLVTKAGRDLDDPRRGDLRPEAVVASCEASLRRLGVEWLDALLLHGPDPNGLTSALRDALEGLRLKGVVRAYGVAGRGPEIGRAAALGFGAIVQAPIAASAPAFAAGAGVIAIETLRPAVDGWRAPRSAADLWRLARAFRQGRLGLGGGPRPSVAQALGAALSHPGVTTALVTTTRLEHLDALVATAALA